MSADDQQFLDVLSGIPVHIRQYTDNIADVLDTSIDRAANAVRSTLSSSPWLPDYMRPLPPPRAPIATAALSRFERVQIWVSRNKIFTTCVAIGAGVLVYKTVQKSRSLRKTRRAKKARNGGRIEVVVIAGSPTLPLTKSMALDMERRGYIVFVVCNAVEDEGLVHQLSRPDIRPLSIDTTNPPNAGAAIERFAMYLQSPQAPAPHIRPNHLTLKSVMLIPSLDYQTSPIATISPSSFADLFNTHLLQPILTIQAFLPLLTSRLQPPGEKWVAPRVLVLTPSIISAINPPFHAPEATVCSALRAFTEVLTAELRPLDIPVTHMQLGTFDFSAFLPARAALTQGANPNEALGWPGGARHNYGANYVSHTSSAISGGRIRGLKGSSLRNLHAAVFDVMDGSITSATMTVGLGAGVYGFVGKWAPRGLVSWMMGMRKVDELSTWKSGSSYEGSSREESEDGEASAREYVAVPQTPEKNVWNSEGDSGLWASAEKS